MHDEDGKERTGHASALFAFLNNKKTKAEAIIRKQ